MLFRHTDRDEERDLLFQFNINLIQTRISGQADAHTLDPISLSAHYKRTTDTHSVSISAIALHISTALSLILIYFTNRLLSVQHALYKVTYRHSFQKKGYAPQKVNHCYVTDSVQPSLNWLLGRGPK